MKPPLEQLRKVSKAPRAVVRSPFGGGALTHSQTVRKVGLSPHAVVALCALGFAAVALLLFPPAGASTTVGPTTLASDTTWDAANSPYFVEGTVIVGAGATLTIDAGTEVRFSGPYDIIVNGGLVIAGNSTDPVVLDANVSNGTISWGRVYFVGTQRLSSIDHASINNASTAIDVALHTLPITITNVSIAHANIYAMRIYTSAINVSVVNLTVRDSNDGVYINNSKTVSIVTYRAENLTGVNSYGLLAVRSVSGLYF